MKRIKIIIAVMAFMVIIMIAAYFTFISIGVNAIIDKTSEVEALKTELIGSKTIVSSDTLIITEFTWNGINNSVSGYLVNDKDLNNKITISVDFAKKNLIK